MTLTPLHIAKTCHEVNRAYCQSIGDNTQLPWAQAPRWQQESALKGVAFLIRNPTVGPSASHENWMKDKLAAGWVYGKVKCDANKTHPCIVPFDKLSEEQKLKDVFFHTIVHALMRY